MDLIASVGWEIFGDLVTQVPSIFSDIFPPVSVLLVYQSTRSDYIWPAPWPRRLFLLAKNPCRGLAPTHRSHVTPCSRLGTAGVHRPAHCCPPPSASWSAERARTTGRRLAARGVSDDRVRRGGGPPGCPRVGLSAAGRGSPVNTGVERPAIGD